MTPSADISSARLAALLLPPLIAMGVIFFLSGQTSDQVDRAWWDVLLRKLAHVTEYAVLTVLWWRALRGLGARFSLALAIAISLGYAATDEFHQTFVEGRQGTPVDVLIDSAGIALAATGIAVLRLRAAADPRLPAERRVGERLDRARQPG
ncbi:MAG: VanZ family protein [Solirubrobacterales bacterium]